MIADDAGAASAEPAAGSPGTFVSTNVLTNLATGLVFIGSGGDRGNDDFHSQGNYDYDAHAQVYWGGADPLGSQGYASEVKNPSSSETRPAKRKARGRFCLWPEVGPIRNCERGENL